MSKVPAAYLEARKQEILDAALVRFVHSGIDGATMQEIAACCDLSAGALYRYFPNKDDLVRAVFEMCEAQHRELFEGAAAESDSPLAALNAVGRAAWERFNEPDAQQESVIRLESALAAARDPESLGVEAARATGGVIEGLRDLVVQAQAAGEVDASLDAAALATLLVAVEEGLRVLMLTHDDEIDADAVLETLMQCLSGGAAPAADRHGDADG